MKYTIAIFLSCYRQYTEYTKTNLYAPSCTSMIPKFDERSIHKY